ncbi:hypothetical protein AVEN_131861-1 [Araneus ventricosus]|uniref:Uncharacterized protein n=1 Tax=Araneus ventricosus TaxID=182803 RepID=A0A4Y2PNP4_ARAVE|nr:hypothetical protein AVEN_131861-1 [Araneus ventricosus]
MLPKSRENAFMYGLTYIGYYKVTFEALRRKGSPGQCSKCQQNFHNSRFRKRDPVLAKCAVCREIAPSPVRPLRSLQRVKATTQQTIRVVLKNTSNSKNQQKSH